MPTPETQDGNCCILDRLLDQSIGRFAGNLADEVAERAGAILACDRHPRAQELAGAIDALTAAAYADVLRDRVAEEVRPRDVA